MTATPRQGERLTLPDGRAFRFTAVDPPDSLRGWWWHATSVTGLSTLQGNFKLKRRGVNGGWEQA
jgi:hypothetical protein